MAIRPSNSKGEKKKAPSQAGALSRAVSFLVLLALSLNAASATTVTVLVGNGGNNFSPSFVTIHPGDTVQWTWSASGHSSTSGTPGMPNGLWDSGILNQGATFSHTFNTVGMFPYFCTPHGQCCGMIGTVNVTAATPTPTATPMPTSTPIPPPTPTPGGNPPTDFNLDGHPDYLLFNPGYGGTVIWYLNNYIKIASAAGPIVTAGWVVVGVGDFNSDGHPDYLLFNSLSGGTVIWYLNNYIKIASAAGPIVPVALGWVVVGVGDFNSDGHPDYLLFNPLSGGTVIWYLNNYIIIGSAAGPIVPVALGWEVAAP